MEELSNLIISIENKSKMLASKPLGIAAHQQRRAAHQKIPVEGVYLIWDSYALTVSGVCELEVVSCLQTVG